MKKFAYPVIFFAAQTSASIANPVFPNDEAKWKETFAPSYGVYKPSKYNGKVSVIKWNSKEGIERFQRTKLKDDFFRLAHHFKPQYNVTNAGQGAASVIISAIYEMNGKKFPLIKSTPMTIGGKTYGFEYRLWNEKTFFNDTTDKIVHRDAISRERARENGEFMGGIDMDELQKILHIHGVKSKLFYVEKYDPSSLEEFRNLVKKTVVSDKSFLLLNHDNSYKSLGAGNFSPVAGYDEKSDSVLILDVAAHKGPWTWVELSEIYQAMNTRNYANTHYRGYLIIDSKL